jgi:hypothetical protein
VQHKIINKWYRSLSLANKAIAMTIVDKDLVRLFKMMYKMENALGVSGGKFTTHVQEARELLDRKDITNMDNPWVDKLVYIKPK